MCGKTFLKKEKLSVADTSLALKLSCLRNLSLFGDRAGCTNSRYPFKYVLIWKDVEKGEEEKEKFGMRAKKKRGKRNRNEKIEKTL